MVGRADFKHDAMEIAGHERSQQSSCETPAAVAGRDGKIEDVDLAVWQAIEEEEPSHVTGFCFGNEEPAGRVWLDSVVVGLLAPACRAR